MSKFTVTPRMFRAKREVFPELARARKRRRALARSKVGLQLLKKLRPILKTLYPIPETTYTLYRQYARSGDRARFERPYFAKRHNLTAAALAQFLEPCAKHLDAVHDYLWDVCGETTWILPAHERGGMDLFATETAFCLTETLEMLRGELAGEVVGRVEHEVRRRVLGPYLDGVGKRRAPPWKRRAAHEPNLTAILLGRQPHGLHWHRYHNNWNGVCSSSVGATLLYLERDPRRLARGINAVLDSLDYFLGAAFSEDGASNEGVAYWQYGLLNFVPFAELLRARTGGQVDLLADPRMKLIAGYPAKVMLSPGRFYNHADCPPRLELQPGVFAKLAEKTGAAGLGGLLASEPISGARVPMALRDLFWWDGKRAPAPKVGDARLPAAGIFRLKSGRLVLAGKAGHNAENHNHNDVGSFVLHAAGEDLLCDPGAPPYSREYFQHQTRYKLFIHTQSRGHNLPAVGGKLQEFGRRFRGRVLKFDAAGARKAVEMEIARAYPVKKLKSLRRRLELAPGGRLVLEDRFEFGGKGLPVEEGFVTWLPVTVKGKTATVRGEKNVLKLRIAGPGRFRLEEHELAAKVAAGATAAMTLRRLFVRLPAGGETCFRMEGELRPRGR